MIDDQENINRLLNKLNQLVKQQDQFSHEINNLRSEINALKDPEKSKSIEASSTSTDTPVVESGEKHEVTVPKVIALQEAVRIEQEKFKASQQNIKEHKQQINAKRTSSINTDQERFIGGNVLSKIGIAITIIGVVFGVKYSIDHNLISPKIRIMLGYLLGVGLLLIGLKLKKKYRDYSSVLVSGAFAIMYFITYTAHSFYNLFPITATFIAMIVFTASTVAAAIKYNRQVIAQIGLVGAYSIPFLLSSNSGNITFLFSYIAIVNAGILVIALRKYWKPLLYSSFTLTWLIFLFWYVFQADLAVHFNIALVFLSIYFIIFYATFLAYKLLKKEKFEIENVLLLLTNAFIFYGIGFLLIDGRFNEGQYLGLFTLVTAIIHGLTSLIIYRQKLADRNVFHLTLGLALVFITIAIPVQFDANWVTLLWAGEAAVLFWIGKTKQISMYEKLSYPLMILAMGSMVHDWLTFYGNYQPAIPESRITPVFNINFLTSLIFIGAFAYINYLNRKKDFKSTAHTSKNSFDVLNYLIPGILVFSIYYVFRIEIGQCLVSIVQRFSGEFSRHPQLILNQRKS